jgi:hypothetical protein
MGAASIKGLVLMETVFPSPDGYTVFDDPQMKKQLVKELKKGTIKPPTASDELDIDEDLEPKIDQMAREIWQFYDPKNLGSINKKAAEKFIKDCFQLYSLRKRCKAPKEALGPGVDMSKATAAAYAMLDPSNTGMVSEKQFIEFINECDLDEIVGPYTGQTGPKDINSRLPQSMMFDPSTLPKDSSVKVGEIKFRDYNQGLEG